MAKHPAEIAENLGKLLRLERNGTSVMVYFAETEVESATATELVDLDAALTYFENFDIEPGVLQEAFIQDDGDSIYVAFDESQYRYRMLQDDATHFTTVEDLMDGMTENEVDFVLNGTLPAFEVYLLARGKALVAPLASETVLKADIQDTLYTLFKDYANDDEMYKLMSDKGYISSGFVLENYSNANYWDSELTAAADMTCSALTMLAGDGIISDDKYISSITLTTTNDFDPDDTAATLPVIKCSATIDEVLYTFYAYRTSETAMNILYNVEKNRAFLDALRDTYGNIVSNEVVVVPADITGQFSIDILEY